MLLLTQGAWFLCDHGGRAEPEASQHFVFIDQTPVLVHDDPEGVEIDRCPHSAPPNIKRCERTLVADRGYSTFLRIGGRRVCLSGISGFTDGMPPGVTRYAVHRSGQRWVRGE